MSFCITALPTIFRASTSACSEIPLSDKIFSAFFCAVSTVAFATLSALARMRCLLSTILCASSMHIGSDERSSLSKVRHLAQFIFRFTYPLSSTNSFSRAVINEKSIFTPYTVLLFCLLHYCQRNCLYSRLNEQAL